MTVTVQSGSQNYAYTGPGLYEFTFGIFEDTDLYVTYTDTDGAVTVLNKDVDYTVTINNPGIAPSAGSITTTAPTATNGTLRIARELPLTQAVDWQNHGALHMDILEAAFDKITMLVQQVLTELEETNLNYSWKGTWAALQEYSVNDFVVAPNTSIYICNTAHTASAWSTDLASGYWDLFIDVETLTDLTTQATDAAAAAQTAAGLAVTAQSNAEQSAAICAAIEAIVDQCALDAIAAAERAELAAAQATSSVPITESDCINGTFAAWQRATSSSALGYVSADRFINYFVNYTSTLSRQTYTPGDGITVEDIEPPFTARLQVTQPGSPAAGDFACLQHKILDVRRYSGKTLCINFWAKADAAKDIAVEVYQMFGSGGSSANLLTPQTVSLTTSWTEYTLFLLLLK